MPPELRSRDLDRQRNAIEIGANPLDDGKILRGRLKPPMAEPRPFLEQRAAGDCPVPAAPSTRESSDETS